MIVSYFELMKCRLTLMVLATTALGFLMGSGPHVAWGGLWKVFLGTFLVGGGANALNQFFEKDIDARMERTKNRPLPSGRLRGMQAFLFGATVTFGGILFLSLAVNRMTAVLGAFAALSYLFIYTPLKRLTVFNTFVGAVPGALPIVMGWTAAGAVLDQRAWALFWILYFWQLPHFFAIARIYREDYQRAGLRMMTAPILLYSAVLLPVSFVPARIGMTGNFYPAASLAAGAAFLTFALYMTLTKLSAPKKFIPASILYLTLLIAIMVFDKA